MYKHIAKTVSFSDRKNNKFFNQVIYVSAVYSADTDCIKNICVILG